MLIAQSPYTSRCSYISQNQPDHPPLARSTPADCSTFVHPHKETQTHPLTAGSPHLSTVSQSISSQTLLRYVHAPRLAHQHKAHGLCRNSWLARGSVFGYRRLIHPGGPLPAEETCTDRQNFSISISISASSGSSRSTLSYTGQATILAHRGSFLDNEEIRPTLPPDNHPARYPTPPSLALSSPPVSACWLCLHSPRNPTRGYPPSPALSRLS